MQLLRVTPDPFADYKFDDSKSIGQEADGCQMMTGGYMGDMSPHTRTHFKRFGNGARRSDFEVVSHWENVEQLIGLFCNAGHPQAIEIRDALKLAAAARGSGWEPKISK
jgi:hypothetical protein